MFDFARKEKKVIMRREREREEREREREREREATKKKEKKGTWRDETFFLIIIF